MIQKIGTFLFVMLVIWAVVILLATGSRTAPVRDPGPTVAVTGETAPPSTVPATVPTQPVNQEPLADETPYQQVKRILDQRKPEQTARTDWVWDPDLNAWENTQGTARGSRGRALAKLATEWKMNPIAAFRILAEEGMYIRNEECGCTVNAFPVPRKQKAKTYPATEEGAQQLLTELLTLASELEDSLELEKAILGSGAAVRREQVRWDPKDGCWYAYFAAGGERSTHILCLYLRANKAGEQITDVEFQLLNLRSATGSDYDLEYLDRRGSTQSATLMAAAELLLTGKSKSHGGGTSDHSWFGGYKATVERISYTAEGESAILTNYRLRKK